MIPDGDVVTITDELQETLTDEEINQKVFMNNYAKDLNDVATQRRFQRQSAGFTEDRPPTSQITEITAFAEIRISLSTIASLIGDVDTATARRRGRMLQSYDNNGIEIDIQDFMSFEYVRGQDAAEADMLRFEPYLKAFGGTELVVQFEFENPLEVSIGSTPDQIVTKFTDPRLLYDAETGMFIQNSGMVSELPRMLMSDSATDVLMASCNILASATNTALLLFILIGLSLTAMTKSIWHFINVM